MSVYDSALSSGFTPDEFWDSSPVEIYDRLNGFRKRQEQDQRAAIIRDFVLAEVIAREVLSEKGAQPPKPWNYYPQLFRDEKKAYEEKIAADEMETAKENRRAYMQEFNRRKQLGL